MYINRGKNTERDKVVTNKDNANMYGLEMPEKEKEKKKKK